MKRIFLFAAIVALSAASALGQKTFEVRDFSDKYSGRVHLADPSEVFSEGWVEIYDKRTKRRLLRVDADRLAVAVENGTVRANVLELPYGEQSAIVHDDFNFDGYKDFALMDGQNSCYGGPSFRVFLWNRATANFAASRAFTRLAQEYCGMFRTDPETRTVSAMTKSGCCWHQYDDFDVVGSVPRLRRRVVEDAAGGGPFVSITTETRKAGRRTVSVVRKLISRHYEDQPEDPLLSFKLADGGEVLLFDSGEMLSYAKLDRTGNVEFAYPQDSKEPDPLFFVDSKASPTQVYFFNKDFKYSIGTEPQGGFWLMVNRGKQAPVRIAIDQSTVKGGLARIVDANLQNVKYNQITTK